MKSKISLPFIFVFTSVFALGLGTYLLATKTTLQPQLFITTCGEVLKNIQEHVHFNLDGALSAVILFVAFIGAGLGLWQLIKFLISHRRLHQLRIIRDVPENLAWVMRKHHLSNKKIILVSQSKLTAYTIGLFKPSIVVSQPLVSKLSREQLEAVVLHELYHLRSHHLLWLLLSRLISSTFFFIPLIGYLARQLRTEFELAADAFVIDKQKTRDHLRSSLALNLQYTESLAPHFATSPIERRVESLASNKSSRDRIGMKQLAISFLSFSFMLGIAFIQPSQIVAETSLTTGGVCEVGEECKTTGCSSHQGIETHYFSPRVPASFSLTSSH